MHRVGKGGRRGEGGRTWGINIRIENERRKWRERKGDERKNRLGKGGGGRKWRERSP
jgi:hypothetical protein